MERMRDSWGRRGLADLVAATGASGLRVVEVGSYAGESADVFASLPQVALVWCVDPWKAGYDDGDVASSSDFAEVEAAFDKVAARHPGKVRKFKGTLRDFRAVHPDARPDLVYIDAEHTYDAVARDIADAVAWRPRFVAGHDYNPRDWPGVARAVDEAFGRQDRVFLDTSWLVRIGGGG